MSLKKELVSGTIYMAVAKYSGLAMTILITAILSRLLTPENFGVVALAGVMLALFNLLADIGIGPAVIQNKTLTAEDMNSLNTFNSYQGLVLGVAFFLSAPYIAEYYGNPQVTLVCRVMSVNILMGCVNAVPNNILYRQQRFKLITIISLSFQFIGGAISIAMAFHGCGPISLVLPSAIMSIPNMFILRYITKVHFVWRIDWSPLKRIFSFSAFQFLANMVGYLSRNMDSMLVGKYMGMKQLGYYNKSYNLQLMPLQYISGVLIPVMLPVFSKYQDNLEYIQQKYSQILRFFAFIGVPLCALLYFCADELILLFFGDQWGQSVPCFKILAISVPFQIMGCSSGSIFQATGHTKAMFWNSFIGAFFTLGSFAVGVIIFGTIEALAWGYTAAMIITTFICFYIMYTYALKSSFLIYLQKMVAPAIFGVVLCIVLYFTSLIPVTIPIVAMLIKGVVGVAFSIFYIQFLGYYDVFAMLRKGLVKVHILK
ncbi:lipopolysaccharide biosynthesis protein [uncultured Prevotella sp.]|uniref:lipopolysaccharide biosynthesis protein n=1 Tax=uncultured Prevotella sp. TaxID=159272 RepID=UPI00266C0B59|nr:lipopolysaccharide biosynthesis protein [uncultured Prevotella sp.]